MEKDKLVPDELALSPDLKKEIDNIKEIIRSTLVEFHNNDFRKYISNYKKYLQFTGERLFWIEDWQTNTDYPMVSSVVDTMFGNIFDFWYQFWLNDSTLRRLCNEAFDFRWAWKEAFRDITKEVLITGKAFAKDYLIKEKVSDTFWWQKVEMTIKVPSIQYVSVFDVLYDRSKWLKNSPFQIVRTFMTWDAITAKYGSFFDDKTLPKFKSLIKNAKDQSWYRFSMYDYNPVKMLTSVAQNYNAWDKDKKNIFDLPFVTGKTINQYTTDNTIGNEDKNNYFLPSEQSNYEVIDYSAWGKRYVFANGLLIWFWKKERWIGELHEANFSAIPGTGSSNGVADNLGWLQDIQASLWNAFIDNIKLILGPMFKVSWNTPIGKNWTIDFKKFRAIRTTGQNDIEKIQLWVTDFAPMNFMQMVQSVSEQRSWVNNYVMGWQWTIERVSWGIDMKYNQYKSKLTPITDSIDQMMGWMARCWVNWWFKYFTREELKELWVTVEEVYDDNNKFVTFNINGTDIKTIIDERNITFSYNSLYRLTKENSRSDLKEAFPFILQYAPDKLNMEEMVKVLSWMDFDPDNIIKKQEPTVPTWSVPPTAPTQDPMQVSQEWQWQMSDDEILQQVMQAVS